MRKAEQRLWDSMKRNRPKDVRMERVENVAADGMPDVHVSARGGVESWVELKVCSLPVRNTTPVLGRDGLRPSQKNWLKSHCCTYGLRGFVLVRDDRSSLYLLPGALVDEINSLTLDKLVLKSVARNWEEIFEALKGERP